MTQPPSMTRRCFVGGALAAATAAALPSKQVSGAPAARPRNKICAFVKFLQSLSYQDLAATIAELGFDGIEATVRDGGQVLPERVEEDLPKLVEALRRHDLEITVMASSVNRVDEPNTEKVLRTAAALGVRRYRMKNYRYDLSKPVTEQLDQLRPVIRELADLNRELGVSAVYQNHSGSNNVGAPVWDLHYLIKDYPAQQLGSAFDIRHATVEGGLAWPIHLNLMRPHIAVVYVKDFVWDGRKPKNVPLGRGLVSPTFFPMLMNSGYDGPISVHVEYLQEAGVRENVAALRNDLKTLRGLLAA